MKIRHTYYGCETGCCGYELYEDVTRPNGDTYENMVEFSFFCEDFKENALEEAKRRWSMYIITEDTTEWTCWSE